jgi:hypothetical protein
MGEDQGVVVAAALHLTLVAEEEVVEGPSSCSTEAAEALTVVEQQLMEDVAQGGCSVAAEEVVLRQAPSGVEVEV